MTAAAILTKACARLTANGVEEPDLNAQWLLADALGLERLNLLADRSIPVPPAAAKRFEKTLKLKESGLPLAYILGWQNFRGLRIGVDERVLVPRPETEELAALAADHLRPLSGRAAALDYGAGSGAIGLWLAHTFPALTVTAAEISAKALACARGNARALGLSGRMNFIKTASLTGVKGPFDVIVSNPPYIPSAVIPGLSPEVQSEPLVALDGGGDGLDVARMLVKLAPGRLKKGGALILELGADQAKELLAGLDAAVWTDKKIFKDLNGLERFFHAVKR
ncbi:MAG TPA: peptide chain release factor N(5)-glutamine methyltransferase [Elusimicrobia bacterium]|nr:MAG: protein-(glutamine-N5) methyltransferase, release factor-specific [Elusimicrobia bacterium GWF2_62_30]HBA60337.1 peptide chain release factor N(5)-glutamine methyltransferase [Elusimicrobiota bacterium]